MNTQLQEKSLWLPSRCLRENITSMLSTIEDYLQTKWTAVLAQFSVLAQYELKKATKSFKEQKSTATPG